APAGAQGIPRGGMARVRDRAASQVLLAHSRGTRAAAHRAETLEGVRRRGDTSTGGRMTKKSFRITDSKPDAKRDVDDEVAFHLEMRAREFMEQGMSADEARQKAAASF